MTPQPITGRRRKLKAQYNIVNYSTGEVGNLNGVTKTITKQNSGERRDKY